jgi:large subunit ribosomal protein L29
MKAEEVRSKTDSELRFDMNNLKEELFHLRLRGSAETLSNPSRIREVRRAIARIQTVLHERTAGIRGAAPRT